jgi:hypothetical protein
MEVMGDLAAGGALPWAMLATADAAASSAPASAIQKPAAQSFVARFRGLRSVPAGRQHPDVVASDGGGSGELAGSLELLKVVCSTAVADAGLLGFREAADFAANVEEVSRSIEYLQIVAAGAVDRTRREATSAARSGSVGSGSAVGWVTGWGAESVVHEATGWVTGSATESAANPENPESSAPKSPTPGSSAAPDPADDGSRNAAEFLRTRLRISAPEARRRIALAANLLPRTGFTGHTEPAERPELAAAVAAGTVASPARDHHHDGPRPGPAPRH